MRPFWKGFITFGLVSIPIKLFPATESKGVSFSLLHKECGSPIHYRKFCDHCNKEVAQDELIKGYEFSKGQFVTFTEEELNEIPTLNGKQVEIIDFVNLQEVDPIYFQKSYYLAPSEGGEKPYALLLSALKETNRIAIAKVVLRTKENIAMVRVFHNNTLAFSTVYYPDEIRNPAMLEIPENAVVNDKELAMAKTLIDTLTVKFEPEKYHDHYRETLNEIIQKKILNERIELPPEKAPANVVDLTEALRLSLEKLTGERTPPEKVVKGKTPKTKTRKTAS